MELNAFIDVINRLAPPETALSFDNSGLVIAPERTEIRRVLVALDCTVSVAEEAALKGAELVVTHHPLLFSSVKRISPTAPETAAVYKLIRNGVGLFSAHTNLDAAEGGVNTELCRLLGLKNAVAIPPENIMRVGELECAVSLDEFARFVEKRLVSSVRVCGDDRLVRRVAVMGGSGGGDCRLAAEMGADAFVTGECKHSDAIAAAVLGLSVIVAGHYETEKPVIEPLIRYLQAHTDGVEYIRSECDAPVFRCV